MRIVAGQWRGRALIVPPGQTTRPTADRVRQALFDMLLHAPWGGRGLLDGATVLDGFAGTGALGLEALSRGAKEAVLIERDPAALRALRANVAVLRAGERARVLAADMLVPPLASFACNLVFLDPPYRQDLVPKALAALKSRGWIAPDALIVAEYARDEPLPAMTTLAEREQGAARIVIWRAV
ncbi:16S rRNA (guanine(966)-N(2))-methyltransferase RsmD [Granulibacter bethesdensis]|uniref:16S rRNA (guanine(966)-N(2))-methyltransferase RsmD n=1 Tax=Granulibacter bethesdensis TaxID=364410 RepID=UPI0003F201DC|nr:16S rRNA (guanine(966)-N(2))-methyltransferase RsmD [Granulibacter bethesdensis]AHJ64856.1 Methyltransferase [Granulibacter bethesdensis CGDNIH4]